MNYDQDSILATIKKMLGIDDNYAVFDMDIIVLINAALMSLQQLDVGPKDGFSIHDYTQTWHQFLTNEVKLEAAKTYVYLKVKTAFDPPSSSFVMTAYENQIKELEWRLNVQAESVEKFDWMDDDGQSSTETNVNVVIDGENMTVIRNSEPESQRIVIEEQHTVVQEVPEVPVIQAEPTRSVTSVAPKKLSTPQGKQNYAIQGETLQLFTPGLFG